MHGSDGTDRELDGDGARLAGAFRRTVGALEPDLGGLIAGAAQDGRSLRRRRRGLALGALAVAVALTAGAVQLAGGGGGTHGTSAAADGAPGQASPGQVLPAVGGRPALTGQDLLFAAVHAMPQGVEMGGAAGQTTVFSANGKDTPQLHVTAMATGPNDLLGTQFLSLSYDSDLAAYLKQPNAYDATRLAGPDGRLACTALKPDAGSGETVDCLAKGTPDSGRTWVITRSSKTNLIVQAVYQELDGTVVSATVDRENPVPGPRGGGPDGKGGQLVPPSLTADVLTAIVRNPEIGPWISPDFHAAAAATVQPYVDTAAPRCPLGPGGGMLTVMPSPRPTSAPASAPYPSTYPAPDRSPQAGASRSAGKPSPSGCPSPGPWHSGSSGGPGTQTVPVWPATG